VVLEEWEEIDNSDNIELYIFSDRHEIYNKIKESDSVCGPFPPGKE